MDKWKCTICEYVYDPATGDPDNGVVSGTPFEKIPDTWVCPICGAGKDAFEKE
jgi:rubredoxin